MEERKCPACQYDITEENEKSFDGTCPECGKPLYWCDYCGEYYLEVNFDLEIELCNACVEDNFSECEDCGELFSDSELIDGLCWSCEDDRLSEEEEEEE